MRATLLFWKFPDIEKEVSELYTARSAFVHGSFFSQIAKDSTNGKDLPLPDFGLLYKQKEYVRFALVAYLHLAQLLRQNPAEYKDNKTIITTLERGIMDLELRAKITEEIKTLFALMPESSFKLVY